MLQFTVHNLISTCMHYFNRSFPRSSMVAMFDALWRRRTNKEGRSKRGDHSLQHSDVRAE